MDYAIGKVKDEKKVLFIAKVEDRIIGVDGKKFQKSLAADLAESIARDLASELASEVASMAADAATEAVTGAAADAMGDMVGGELGGLVGGFVGDKVEEKLISAFDTLITECVDKMSDAAIMEGLLKLDPVLEIPLEKLQSTKGKTKGMMSKKYHVTTKSKGFLFFSSSEEIVFQTGQQANAEKVFGVN